MKNLDAWRDEIAGKSKPDKPLQTRENMNETLYVHMVANTHDDIGWLKTIDEYFSGTNTESQYASVSLIITGVVKELIRVKTRKFTYVEIKFFSMWYDR